MKEDDMVDLEQFRRPVLFLCGELLYTQDKDGVAECDRLLSIIDSAGVVECAEPVAWQRRYAHQLPAGGLCAWREITRDEYEKVRRPS